MFIIKFGFFVFLAVSLLVYYLMPGKLQWFVLLVSSLVFYFLAANPRTFVYLLMTMAAVWAGGCGIEKYREDKKKAKAILILSIVVVAGLLTLLKYTNFFLGNLKLAAGLFGMGDRIPLVSWISSLGISFYSLQAISYLADVYWETSSAQKNPLKAALFTCYFPQMSSGPICRYHQMENQLYAAHRFQFQTVCFGLWRMLFGFIKKLVIADNLNQFTGDFFAEGANYNGWFMIFGIFLYVIQIYADFSGCMDIVLGASECFGIRMPENFNRPFHSTSIQEFWKRWHITLGSWAQDYIMYPILRSKLWGKMRKGLKAKFGKKAAKQVPAYVAMMILWGYIGLWHGGGWNFIAEGVWFGCVVIIGQLLEKQLNACKRFLHIKEDSWLWHAFSCTRTAVIYSIGAIFFKSPTVRMGLHYIKAAVSPRCLGLGNLKAQAAVFLSAHDPMQLQRCVMGCLIGIVLVAMLLIAQAKEVSFYEWLSRRNIILRWVLLYIMIFAVLLCGVYGPGFIAADFIYGAF